MSKGIKKLLGMLIVFMLSITIITPVKLHALPVDEIGKGPEPSSIVLEDKATGIKVYAEAGTFDEKVQLVVKKVERSIANREVEAYDIYFVVDGVKVQPLKPVRVVIPTNNLNTTGLEVLHELETNKFEKVTYKLVNKTVEFSALDFSVYALSATKGKDLPSTGQETAIAYLVVGGAVMLVGLWFILKKNKDDDLS